MIKDGKMRTAFRYSILCILLSGKNWDGIAYLSTRTTVRLSPTKSLFGSFQANRFLVCA
jgi:hypothetical protein